MDNNRYNAANHISRFLTVGTMQGIAQAGAADDDNAKPTTKDEQQKRHELLKAHHRATFHESNSTLEKAKQTSQILVDSAKPDDDKSGK